MQAAAASSTLRWHRQGLLDRCSKPRAHLVPRVVDQAADVPDAAHVLRLRVVALVGGLAGQLQLTLEALRQRQRGLIQRPRPRARGAAVRVLAEFGWRPGLAAIGRDVHADDVTAAAAPRVPLDGDLPRPRNGSREQIRMHARGQEKRKCTLQVSAGCLVLLGAAGYVAARSTGAISAK